jgi:hypothetical protein
MGAFSLALACSGTFTNDVGPESDDGVLEVGLDDGFIEPVGVDHGSSASGPADLGGGHSSADHSSHEGEGSSGELVDLPVIPCTDCDLWSDPDTWGGTRPVDGDEVTIPAGMRVVLDEDSADLAGLNIDGELIFARKDLNLTTRWIMVHGALRVGSPEAPYRHRALISLTATNQFETIMGMGTRGIVVMDGTLELHGVTPESPWVRLEDHAGAGATHLTLSTPAGWDVGERVVVAPTDFYGVGETELMTITAVDTQGIQLDTPLATSRWGRLQYATTTGMSETDAGRVNPPVAPTPTVLDERAEVALLSRNIVIEAPDDAAWRDDGFGAHVMIMGAGSKVTLDGIEVRRGGQRGRLGRYPIHWHLLSYTHDGQEIGDVSGHVVQNSTIWDSSQRCIVIHGTNGVVVRDNVCYSIEGHAIFLEDAVERRNTIEGNAVFRVRNPRSPMLVHEGPIFQGGSSGFWITNPDNTVVGNVAADAEGIGFWLSFSDRPFGLSSSVPIIPRLLDFGVFDENTAHSNKELGLNLDWGVTDDAGNVFPIHYSSQGGDADGSPKKFSLSRFTSYKHFGGGVWSRSVLPEFLEFVCADNMGFCFAGGGHNGLIARALVVGESLNSGSPPSPAIPPVGIASYHSLFDIQDNVLVNFPFVPGRLSGAFGTNDYYTRGVDKGLARSSGNLLVASAGGFRAPRESDAWTFAGALWDPHGYFGTADRYWTYDDPFLTAGTNCAPVEPAGQNGMACTGPYYGVGEFVVNLANNRYSPLMAIEVTRQDAGGATLGTWSVLDGALATKLPNMRHFAALRGGRYLLRFPTLSAPSDVGMTIENASSLEDGFVLGVHFTGSKSPQVYVTSSYDYLGSTVTNGPTDSRKRIYTPVSGLGAVAASQGGVFWQDSGNEVVWIKIQGGLEVHPGEDPNSDAALYLPHFLRIH